MLSLVNVWMARQHSPNFIEGRPDDNTYQLLGQSLFSSRFRYVIATALLSLGGLLVSHTSPFPRSSYICAGVLSNARIIPLMQSTGFALDLFIFVAFSRLIESIKSDSPSKGSRTAAIAGWALLVGSQSSQYRFPIDDRE